ncbi:hypothetical protein [Insolitispirillum peregrinum]
MDPVGFFVLGIVVVGRLRVVALIVLFREDEGGDDAQGQGADDDGQAHLR